ncbi:hypothetical protein [Bacillus velezensis]
MAVQLISRLKQMLGRIFH